jgi:hypothetical protein
MIDTNALQSGRSVTPNFQQAPSFIQVRLSSNPEHLDEAGNGEGGAAGVEVHGAVGGIAGDEVGDARVEGLGGIVRPSQQHHTENETDEANQFLHG